MNELTLLSLDLTELQKFIPLIKEPIMLATLKAKEKEIINRMVEIAKD